MSERAAAKILIVDDEPEVCELLSRLLTRAGHCCQTVSSAEQAMETLHGDRFQLVLVDLMMPGMSGIDLLTFINSQLPGVAVVMETGVDDLETALMTFELGAFGYVTKPFRPNDVIINVASALERQRLSRLSRENETTLAQKVKEKTQTIEGMGEELVSRLLLSASSSDNETIAHAWRIGLYSALLARYLLWDEEAVQTIRLAAPLHDIGKTGIPEQILFKPDKLTAEESEIAKRHTLIGGRILSGSSLPVIHMAQEIAMSHHEKWNGGGYPQRLSGTRIPESARIVSIVDAYDTLTTNQRWRPAFSEDHALRTMNAYRRDCFDQRILDYFFSLLPQIRRIAKEVPDNDFGSGPTAEGQTRANIALPPRISNGDRRRLSVATSSA